MIKVLKLSNKSVTRFSTNKKWNYSTLDSGSNIILEQGDNIPLFSSSVNKLSTEQNSSEFQLNMRFGKKISGTFFSKDSKHFDETKEPLNYDGSYQRVVYNSIKHLFYNDYGTVGGNDELNNFYKNPLNLFGSETGIYSSSSFNSKTLEEDPRSERRVLRDEVTVLEVPSNVFGEKIKPGTLKITDHSSDYDSIEIVDDGNTNLIVGAGNFNNVNEMNLNNNLFSSISETSSADNKINIDYTDLSYGYTIDTHGDFLLSGAPILSDSASENQSGRASLHKYNPTTKKHEIIKNFYCPFTQNGIAHENRNDNCEFILTELGDIISSEDFLVNDDFGKSVSINDTICAIGSPGSHINGRHTEQATGHIFVYHKDKGGKENWGIVNVFEGTPNSEFGHSVSINEDFIAVGSPNFEDGIGCVYLFKKTKRTKEHPWIKTSSVYDSYKWNDLLEKYEGIPKQDDTKYKDYVKTRDSIVSRRIEKIKAELKKIKETGVISELEYLDRLPTKDDFSEIFPFEYLYTTSNECGETDTPWFKEKIWSKNTHPATRCNSKNSDKHYNKSVWPGYITDEKTDLYIPNPDHEQNKDNKWAYRWKLQNVEGGPESIHLFGEDADCELGVFTTFEDSTLGSFGDSKLPPVEYSETPKYAIGDVTFDLIGVIKSPDKDIKRFGEKVVLNKNKLYISSYSTDDPKCFMFQKTTNEFGCEVWDLKNTISETQLLGHASNYKIDDSLNYAQLNHYDSYFEIEICPKHDNYDKWIYSFDKPILNSEKVVAGGSRVDKCDSKCRGTDAYNYYSRFRHIGLKESGHLKHNYGESTEVVSGESGRFYKRPSNYDPYSQPLLLSQNETIELSWKRFRENVSFAYTNVPPGKHKSKMTIYSNKAKLKDGTYDEKETLAEIEANETLNNKKVRLIINSGLGESEYFYEFLFRGSPTGTHYTLNELVDKIDYACTLPPNSGSFVDISDKLNDTLNNHGNCKFFSKEESANSYSEPWGADDEMAISWKNFRENVSFSYPSVKSGNHPSFMTIYANEAKLKDGTYDPIHTLAEIGANETLNGKKVRLTFNSGFVNGDEYYYDFIYRGSIEGTHYTLNELRQPLRDYDCTLPANLGESVSIKQKDFNDPLGNKKYARFFSKGTNKPYTETNSDNDTIALSWKNFRENVSFSYPSVKSGIESSFMTIYANEAKNNDGTYNPLYTLAEIGAQNTLEGHEVRLNIKNSEGEYYYEFLYQGTVEGTHFTLDELNANELFIYGCTLPPNQGESISIADEDFDDPLENKQYARFFSKGLDSLSYVEPWSDDDTIALSWKNVRENISFSYPSVKSGKQPSFMTIYSNEAKRDDGTYNPLYTLAEIGAQETLNGKTVRLTFNTGFVGGDEYYYDFIYRGSIEGTHYTLNELRTELDEGYAETQLNSGDIRYIKNYDKLNIHKRCRLPKFYTKSENQLSYVEPYSSDDHIAISWKNFRENISFSYPNIKAGSEPSFMTIYSNEAKQVDGTYDPIYTLAEIGADNALNGQKVKLYINADNCEYDNTYYYEFIYDGSVEGTHYTLNELKSNFDYECTLPPNLGKSVELKSLDDRFKENNGARFFSKSEDSLSFLDTNSTDDTLGLSWKNFRENVSFSYPRVKQGTKPSFMAIYSNDAKRLDGTYDPMYMLAEIGAHETLNNKMVRLTINSGFVNGDEHYYEFLYRGSIQGTHFTLNELKTSYEYECTLPPNHGGYVSISDKNFKDALNNKSKAKFYSKGEDELSYVEPWSDDKTIALSWKNVRENVSFSYPAVKSGSQPSFMTIYSNEAKNTDGTYDPIHTLAEIGAQDTLNGKKVRLTFNTGFVGGVEYYYEFIYTGSAHGTHYTLNELKESFDYECTLPPNMGKYVSLSKIEFDDYLDNNDKAKFFTKSAEQSAYIQNSTSKDEIAISWKNFRENVSFSYPKVKSGNEPSFMSIYSNDAKDKKGRYDPIKTLAEIGADTGLNGKIVRLTFNTGSTNDDEFYYEFKYDGSLTGKNYTLNELAENDLLQKVESVSHIQRKTNSVIKSKVSEKIRRTKVEKIQKEKSNKITTTKNKKLNTIKSFGLLEKNKGNVDTIELKLRDDILQSSGVLKFYSRGEDELHNENTKLRDEIEIDWSNFREGVSFYYPIVLKEDNNTPVKMTIYSNHDILDGYDKNRKLAEITTNSGLNGEVVRLNLEPKESDSIFYEFMFDGQPDEGSHYTLEELSEKIPNNRLFKSNNTTPTTNSGTIKNQVRASSIPLIIYSNDTESCKVKIDKNKIKSGRHNLYILLVDSKLKPIGNETKIEMYNNPSFYNLEDRRNLVKKSYGYSNNIKSEFGKGIDASDKYLVIGNPSDRVYHLNSETSCVGGSAFVYKVNDDDLNFIEKIYGEDEYENNFSSGFGNDVSILGSNFLVGSYSHEMSDMTLTETNSSKRLDIEDLEFGVAKFTDEVYTTTDALITDYEVDLSSEFGDALIKVKLDGLNIDKSLISESTLRANFIDTGNETIRITQVEGENTESVNGTYRLVKSPIQIKSGCEIDFSENYRVYINKNNWSIFFDKLRGAWILTDTPNVSVEYEIPSNWTDVLKHFERINLLDKFNILTEEMINTALSLYNIIDEDITTTWRARKQKEIPKNNIRYADLFRELESVTKLKLNPTIIERLFYLYSSNSRKKIDISILNRWKSSNQNIGVLPFIYELDSVNPISLNFDLLIKTLEVYNLKDYEIAKTWSVKLGYEYLLGDLIDDIRPNYHDSLSMYNLRLISKIAFDFINDRNYSDSKISKQYFKNLVKEDIGKYLDKWKPHVENGFLLSDVFKDMNENININFSISDEASEDDLPTKFSYGVGTLSNKEVKVFSNNDTSGDNLSLTWGVYRDATKIVGNQIYFYVNLLPGAKLDDTVVFVYNSVKSAINGYAYYYSIDNETGKCKKMKRMKTNKKKYSCKKQYGFAVSLSNNFICVGSPVLGNFNIDEIITFGGSSVVSFGTSEKMYIEYNAIHPSYISELGKNIVGTIISYDHSAIKDNKKHYIGNVFYKNGVIALTDREGYFTNVLSNSGVSGFELEFKSMHTLYENEILCKVEPHEFNFSTNPTAVATGRINYDINSDGRFDIIDASYIYKYIMGEIGPIEKSDEEIIEEHNSIKLGSNNDWPKQDLLMTESEDALLMDLFVNSEILEKRPDYEKILVNLKEKYENGDFDINGDGKTDEVDANLLLRYFLGRRGNYLTRNLISKYDDSTRKDSSSIIKYLDEQTGKNLGKEILKDFQDFSENDKKDSLGSYLAPYATTIGLYSGLDLVMVAKLGKPVKILPNYPINFLIKFDN